MCFCSSSRKDWQSVCICASKIAWERRGDDVTVSSVVVDHRTFLHLHGGGGTRSWKREHQDRQIRAASCGVFCLLII